MSNEASKPNLGERMEAAITLVVRAACLIENEGTEGAAFADELQLAIERVRAAAIRPGS